MVGFGNNLPSANNQFTRMNVQHEQSLINKAVNFHAQGHLLKAEKAYLDAINAGVLNVAVFSNLGIIYQSTQRIEQAIICYKKAINVNPNHHNPYANMGGLYKDVGER